MTSSLEMKFDRARVRRVVEDHWRGIIPLRMRHHFGVGRLPPQKNKVIEEMTERLLNQIRAWGDSLPPEQGKQLDHMFAEEMSLTVAEWKRDPVAYARRLGVLSGRISNRQGIGEMAVRTAVRASIWEGIARLFGRS